MPDIIIDDDRKSDMYAFPPNTARGLIPRDYAVDPVEMFAAPDSMVLIPRSEWSDRIKEQEATKSRLSDIRTFTNLDQGQNGYCWSHSTVHAVMVQRQKANQPFEPLSAYGIAAIIKKGRNEGGWCGLSAKFAREVGVPSQKYWPQLDRSLAHDTALMRTDAATRKVTEDWVDLTREVYDQNLKFDQVASCLLQGVPCPVDFNWWAHSVCALDLVEVEPGSFGLRILNSWKDWGENGMGVLRGSKAIPDGALAIRVTGGS